MNHSFDAESPGRALATALAVPLPAAMATTLAVAIMFGGAPMTMGLALVGVVVAGTILLVLAIRAGGLTAWTQMPLLARIGTGGAALLPLLQLIPVPAGVWHEFPGRALERSVLSLVGLADTARTISVAPADTAIALMMMFPLAGMLLGALVLRRNQARAIIWTLAGLILGSFVVGAFQVASAGALRFYDTPHNSYLLGFFTNKNHSALLMATGILVGNHLVGRSLSNRDTIAVARLAIVALGLAAILATASRFGLVMGAVASAIVLIEMIRPYGRSRKSVGLLAIGVAVCAAMLVVAYSGTASRSIARYGDLSDDQRMVIWINSAAAARQFFPVGTGMGTFSDVYRTVEPVASLAPTYANHAHNEYIELAIEGGIAALLLVAVCMIAWLSRWWMVARMRPDTGHARDERDMALLGATILVLPALHSLVDYPARTAALGMLFAMSFGWLMRPTVFSGRGLAPPSPNRA